MKSFLFTLLGVTIGISAIAQNERQLQEVTVIASRTTNNAEGYTTSLRGSDIAKGKPVADVLSFLPNISREDGNFKINGLAVSEIYVDGVKMSDIAELNNIPGDMIDKVQVKYLAGADQNAGLSGGTIMITLRRPSEGGYYGSVTADADWYRSCDLGNEGLGGLINYRFKNLSVYDNLYIGRTKQKENSDQWIEAPDMQSFIKETTESKGFDVRNRLSLTQQFKSGAQLGGSYFILSSRPRPNSVAVENNIYSNIDKRINTLAQEGTIKYYQPLTQKGTTMELTADYYNRLNNETANYAYDRVSLESTVEKTNLDLWKFKADFIYPHSRSLIWKFGASTQWINSTYRPRSLTENERFDISTVPTKTTGVTPVVYASAQGRIWKLRYSAGVNWQLNRISYEDRSVNQISTNTQWSINPTVQVMMPFGAKKNHALMINYKRTLSDIPYSSISSVVNWRDPYNYTVGNPSLKAQSSDMIMTGLSLWRNKINITAIYAYSHDRIYWQTFQSADNPEVNFTKPVNISGQGVYGFGVEWIETPAKWWRFKLSGRLEITPENISIEGTHYGKTRCKEYFYFNNNFVLSKGWGGMLNTNVEPTYSTLDRTYHAVYNVTGQVYKSLLKNNLQVAVEFTPVGNRRKLDRQVGNKVISSKYTSPVQYIGLSLIWKFSGGKNVDVNVVDGIQDYHETKDNR